MNKLTNYTRRLEIEVRGEEISRENIQVISEDLRPMEAIKVLMIATLLLAEAVSRVITEQLGFKTSGAEFVEDETDEFIELLETQNPSTVH